MAKKKNATGGNVGEWSEVYVFFRLLGEHEICSCDENLNKTDEKFPILKIIRGEGGESAVVCNYDESSDSWSVYSENIKIAHIETQEGTIEADSLLELLQNRKTWPDKYSKAAKFLDRLNIQSIKAESQKKKDITLQISDVRAGTNPVCGFSIKSYLGSPPTLLNSSTDCTNFLYEISQITTEEAHELNALPQPKDMTNALKAKGAKLTFRGCCKEIFSRNLEQVDTAAECILAELLRLYYIDGCTTIKAATEKITAENPLALRNPSTYKTVIKRLLDTVALGMTPGSEWDGETDRTSGIIVVKPDGDVVTYHIYNRDAFKQYLYMQTKFDKPSRSRHKYGKIFEEGGKLYLKLALQIRFK